MKLEPGYYWKIPFDFDVQKNDSKRLFNIPLRREIMNLIIWELEQDIDIYCDKIGLWSHDGNLLTEYVYNSGRTVSKKELDKLYRDLNKLKQERAKETVGIVRIE